MTWKNQFAQRTLRMQRSAIRELLKVVGQPGMISFAGGLPAPELFPVAAIRQTADRILAREGATALQYGPSEGLPALRDWLAKSFSRPGQPLSRDNVVITNGSQQGLDLLGRVLLDEGDDVALENPTYLAALMAWRPLGVKFVPLRGDADGLCVSELPSQLKTRPKMLYSIPNFQNPQGTTISLDRREQLLAWAQKENVWLIEDNPYGELRFEGNELPHMFHLAGRPLNGVVYLGTFSKVLVPGLRVGYILGSEELIDRVVRAKQAADLHTAGLNQHIIVELAAGLDEHLPQCRKLYGERRNAMVDALAASSNLSFTRPAGGLFLFVTLPRELNAGELLPRALERGVAFVPGEEFHVNGEGKNTLRLSFATANPADIRTGVERLLSVLREGKS